MIAISDLVAHPGNVREDLELTAEFCASIASAGVRIPLQVTPVEGGGCRVIEGHRRLAAAVKVGLEAVPCDVDPGQAADEAGQYVDMLLANSEAYRKTSHRLRRPLPCSPRMRPARPGPSCARPPGARPRRSRPP
jgi:ParB-like nuclease domain